MIVEAIRVGKMGQEECVSESIKTKEGTLGNKSIKGKEACGQTKVKDLREKGNTC